MTADTLTLADFLLARFAEDERLAQATLDYGRERYEHNPADLASINEATGYEPDDGWLTVSAPRVLAECEAKRRIVELHDYGYVSRAPGSPVEPVCEVCFGSRTWDQWPCLTLKLLALPYADHEHYRKEWRQ